MPFLSDSRKLDTKPHYVGATAFYRRGTFGGHFVLVLSAFSLFTIKYDQSHSLYELTN